MSDTTDDMEMAEPPEASETPLHMQLFKLPNKELVKMCWDSKFDPHPKIDSICEYWQSRKTLSEKQKWCLAYFAAYGKVKDSPKESNRYRPSEPQSYKSSKTSDPFDDEEIPF